MPEHTPAPMPHRAVYGYAFYILMFTLFVFYVFWALFPTKEWGFVYMPDKYFAILLPMLFLVGISFFVFIFYPAVNISLLPKIDDLTTAISPDVARQKYDRHDNDDNDDDSPLSWDEMRSVLEAPPGHFPTKETFHNNNRPTPRKEEECDCFDVGDHHHHHDHYHRFYSQHSKRHVDPQYFIDLANVNKHLFN